MHMETIRTAIVKASKQHTCDYCGSKIPKGERYKRSVNTIDGRLYTWKSHLSCAKLCGKIWDYVDPDEGMTSDEFRDAVCELANTFYCPFHCDEYDNDIQDCDRGFDYDVCVERFAKFMWDKELELILNPNSILCWRIVKKEGGADGI